MKLRERDMIESSDSYLSARLRARALRRHFVFQLTFIAVTSLSVAISSAQKIEMTKIVVRNISPTIAPSSLIGAKPIAIYRASDKYLRVEEQSDPSQEKHMLIITREPESWMINLTDHTAVHVVDQGPSFDSRLYIFWTPKSRGEPDPDEAFRGLEFGNEELFFRQNRSRDLGLRKVDEKECKAFALKSGGREVTLLLDPETQKPVQIESTMDGKPNFAYRYLSYETALPFEPSLFEPPAGLKITEQK